MGTLRWVAAFTLDEPMLDRGHRQLLDRVRQAIGACQRGHRRAAAQAIAGLSEASRHHFLEEDELMRRTRYPGYYNHSEQHRRLLIGLERLQMSLVTWSPKAVVAVHYLRTWFALHLLQYDRALSNHVRAAADDRHWSWSHREDEHSAAPRSRRWIGG